MGTSFHIHSCKYMLFTTNVLSDNIQSVPLTAHYLKLYIPINNNDIIFKVWSSGLKQCGVLEEEQTLWRNNPEAGGTMFLINFSILLQKHMVFQDRIAIFMNKHHYKNDLSHRKASTLLLHHCFAWYPETNKS